MWLMSAQSSESSFMYSADSGSTDSNSSSSLSSSCSMSFSCICLTLSWLVCPWGRCNGPLWFCIRAGKGGILDRHILAKCPVFLQMLHTACFAVHWFICLAVKLPPHLQHCSFVLFNCWVLCCWDRGVGRIFLFAMAFTWLFQFGAHERRISFWFCCPLSL